MGIENGFLRNLPSLVFAILGVFAQLYFVRIYSIRRTWARVAFVCQAALYIAQLEKVPSVLHFRAEWLSAVLMMWFWAVSGAAAVVWLSRSIARKPLATQARRPFTESRRDVLRTSLTALGSVTPAVALCTGIIIRKDLTVREVRLKFPNLPKDLQGLRLVQLSDIHLGKFYSVRDLRRAVDAANGLRADLMLVTGDLISEKYDPIDECLLELKRLRAASGIWGCLGNHEMHASLERYTTDKAARMDMQFLRQKAQMLKFGDAKLNLVGVDHQKRNLRYLQHTAELVAPNAFNLLLSHNPDVFPVAQKQGFDLTISGHTHGGQINLELFGSNINVADLATPFTKGAYQIENSSLYVNSGLGTIGVPVRLGSPSEVTLITLCNT